MGLRLISLCGGGVGLEPYISLNTAAVAAPPILLKMSRTNNVARRCEGEDTAVRDQQRAAAALAAAPAPAPHPSAPPGGGVAAGDSEVTVKLEIGAEETLAQLRDRMDMGSARAPAPGPCATFVHIKVEGSTSGEDTGLAGEEGEVDAEDDGDQEGGEGKGDGEGEEEQVVDVGQTGGGKRKRAEGTTGVSLPTPLLQLAAPAPPRISPPSPQHVDMQWVEGHGERCTISSTTSGGVCDWRCSAAAVPGRTRCAHHATLSKAASKRSQQKLSGSLLPSPAGDDEEIGAGGDGGGGGGGRVYTSKYRGVSALSGSPVRSGATLGHNGKNTRIGLFDREDDAARAWDRMMLWCDLHGVVLKRHGRQSVYTSDSIKAALNFAYEGYEGELDELRAVMTQDAMVQNLRQEGRAQPGCKRKRA